MLKGKTIWGKTIFYKTFFNSFARNGFAFISLGEVTKLEIYKSTMRVKNEIFCVFMIKRQKLRTIVLRALFNNAAPEPKEPL
jgi:hypothetical protein